jgi:intraflagellar transport protein 88
VVRGAAHEGAQRRRHPLAHRPPVLPGTWSLTQEDDEQQALQYYMESYRLLPTNIDTNIWLGIYYVKQGVYEKACHYLERASQLEPKEVKWRLMVASCQRRIGNFQKALKIYENIYQEYPENVECLRFLVLLCKDMGLEYEEYARQLSQLEMENAGKAGYENPAMEDFNSQPEPEEKNLELNIDKNANRRVQQQQIKKAPKQEENWGDDMDPNMFGI